MNTKMTMIKSSDILSIWETMMEQKTVGLVRHKLSMENGFNVSCIYKYPENYCGISFTFKSALTPNITRFRNLKSLDVMICNDAMYDGCSMLIVMLKSDDMNEVFGFLCANLLNKINQAIDEATAVKLFTRQLDEWRKLFDRTYNEGLTESARRGLWGELNFLESLLIAKTDIPRWKVVDCWTGSQKSIQDFQGENWALEVKATGKNNDNIVEIHGDRQLDEQYYDMLYLNRVALNVTPNSGVSLKEKVNKVLSSLSSDILAYDCMIGKLAQYGYLLSMENLYLSPTYQIRDNSYYEVKDDFPRIKEGESRLGVENIKYDINLDVAGSLAINENEVINNIEIL